MLDVLAPLDFALYQHYTNWIHLHTKQTPLTWATDFVARTQRNLDGSVEVHLVPCEELFVFDVDWNPTRLCQPQWVPCMQLATRAIFYPSPHDDTDKEAWKLGLLHEFAHLCPPNPTHDLAFTDRYYDFCAGFGLPRVFKHVMGIL